MTNKHFDIFYLNAYYESVNRAFSVVEIFFNVKPVHFYMFLSKVYILTFFRQMLVSGRFRVKNEVNQIFCLNSDWCFYNKLGL